MPRPIQIDQGHISVERINAGTVRLYISSPVLSVSLQLTVEQGLELADGLKAYAGEEHHPNACLTCGRLGGTMGCVCDPRPVRWAVLRTERAAGEGEEEKPPFILFYCGSEAEAKEQVRTLQGQDKAVGEKPGRRYFAAGIPLDEPEESAVWGLFRRSKL